MIGNRLGKYFEILLVEDNLSDVTLIEESLTNKDSVINLNVVKDGIEAMNYLRKKSKYVNSLKPDLILLDLNLPKKSGLDVLRDIKTDHILKYIPVIVLTSSQVSSDIKAAYGAYANAYIVKPINLEGFRNVIRQIENFWFSVVEIS